MRQRGQANGTKRCSFERSPDRCAEVKLAFGVDGDGAGQSFLRVQVSKRRRAGNLALHVSLSSWPEYLLGQGVSDRENECNLIQARGHARWGGCIWKPDARRWQSRRWWSRRAESIADDCICMHLTFGTRRTAEYGLGVSVGEMFWSSQ